MLGPASGKPCSLCARQTRWSLLCVESLVNGDLPIAHHTHTWVEVVVVEVVSEVGECAAMP